MARARVAPPGIVPVILEISQQSLKAAVIGLGVGERHVACYESDPRCAVVAICDTNETKLLEIAGKYPACRTASAAEIFEARDIDVVSIASYDTDHCDHVLAAIAAGKHVFVEKPLCLHDDEFERIDAALQQHPDVQLSSNLLLRRAPQFLEVKERVTAGVLGRLYYIEGDYNYGRIQKITEGWRADVPFYSVTHGGAIHLIDLILWLSGGRVIEVVSTGNQIATAGTRFRHLDMVTALLRFEDGMTAKVAANFGSVSPHHHALAVHGTLGSFVQTYQGGVFYHSRDPEHIHEGMHLDYPQDAKGDLLRAFVCRILDCTPAGVSTNDVMDAMAVSLAVERSLRTRKWESVRYAHVSQPFDKGGTAACQA
jgi:predicted dehydrogenase